MEENGGRQVTENGKASSSSSIDGGGGSRGDPSLESNGDRKRSRENAENDSMSIEDTKLEEKRRRTDEASSNGNDGSTNGVTDNKEERDEKKGLVGRTTARPRGASDMADSQTDEDHDVPIKEIHMSRKEKEEEERLRKLDQHTLDRLKDALSNAKPHNHLNDDEVLNFIHRVDREAQAHSNLQAGSLADESDGSLHEELIAETEDLNLGREVFSRALHVMQQPNNNSNHNSQDRRTIDWVRKAAGLHRSKAENLEAGRYAATGTTGPSGKGKRTTRGMKSKTREERREKGLGILLSVVNEMEPSLGPYPPFRTKRKRPVTESAPVVEVSKTPKTNNRKKSGDNKKKSLVKAPSKRQPEDTVQNNGYKATDRLSRRSIGFGNKNKPTWDTVWPRDDGGPQPYQFPAWKVDSTVFARKVKRLLGSLSRSLLTWSRYEFFYGDVDRAWFGRNEFARRAAQLGIRPGTLLTQREWNVIRRHVRGKPRRFSRRFIEEEYSNLQNYRVRARMLQANPDTTLQTKLDFDFEVLKPIPVGAPISAVARRTAGGVSSPIQRGSVLSFSHGFYIVQLTGGVALLPDFMVARHGPPDVLIPAPRASLVGMREAVFEETGQTSPDASWSGPGPLGELLDLKRNGEGASHAKPASAQNVNSKTDTPKVAEKELLMTAMVSAEMALKRKSTILGAIESLNSEGVFDGTHGLAGRARTSLKKHVTWLLDTLQEANESYRISREYIDSLTELPTEQDALFPTRANVSFADLGDKSEFCSRDRLADSHAVRLLLHAWNTSNAEVAQLRRQGDVSPEMEGLLRSVGQLLLIPTAYIADNESFSKAHVEEALQIAVSSCVGKLSHVESSTSGDIGNFETHLFKNALAARAEAASELQEAADLLNVEFAASCGEHSYR